MVHRLSLRILILSSWLSAVGVWAQSTLTPISITGPSSNRVNFVFLSEGYTTNQLPHFLADATNVFNAFTARSPFLEYRAYLNCYAISVASTDSGSDHPAYGITRNTCFSTSFDINDYLITMPTNSQGQGKVDALLQTHLPDCDLPVVLVNDPTQGGSDGYGRTAIVSVGVAPGSTADLLAHEAAHVLANLGDEYATPSPGYPDTEEPNTTRETRREYIKWKAWISADTPVPTPVGGAYADVVGLFEGAHYHTAGWYRPQINCAMKSPYGPFCAVCRETLILDFYRRVCPVDSITPAAGYLTIAATQPIRFSINSLQPDPAYVTFTWQTNGVVVPGATNEALNLPGAALSPGSNEVTVTFKDATPYVRSDVSQRLGTTVRWTVVVGRVEIQLPHMASFNRFAFRLAGAAQNGFIIQSSSNLAAWTSISTNFLTNGIAWYTNNDGTDSQRFFRAQIRP